MTAPACIGEPVSWPRLEALAAGELRGAALATARAHVDACAACRACLDEIRADVVALPPLPAAAARAPRAAWIARHARALFAGGALATAAVAVLAVVLAVGGGGGDLPGGDLPGGDAPGPRVAVKGAGVVVLSLVRERGGAIAFDPATFADGDRWKVRVTCAPGAALWADVAVYQADAPHGAARASFPLPPARLGCGNDVALPGAFRLTGRAPAMICVALGVDAAPDRGPYASAPRAAATPMACAAVAPE